VKAATAVVFREKEKRKKGKRLRREVVVMSRKGHVDVTLTVIYWQIPPEYRVTDMSISYSHSHEPGSTRAVLSSSMQ
jgi:hypothetical protein